MNALSEWLVAEVKRDGKVYRQEFARGEPTSEIEIVGETKETGHDDLVPARRRGDLRGRSTGRTRRSASACARRRSSRAACASSSPTSAPAASAPSSTTRAASATSSPHVNSPKDPIHKRIVFFEGENEQGAVEVAMQWNSSYQESVYTFANNINTHEGGAHLSGFNAALTRTINKFAREHGLLKEKEDNLEGEDAREGLAAVVSVKLQNPQFEGQTKTKLGNPWVKGFVEQTVNAKLAAVPRGEPAGREADHPEGDRGLSRPPGRAQGTRPDPAQGRLRRRDREEVRRLPGARPRARRDVHRRGQLRRRRRQGGARQVEPGDPAAAREDHQLREEPDRQGALERRDPAARPGDRHRHRRGVRHLEAALPPDRRR